VPCRRLDPADRATPFLLAPPDTTDVSTVTLGLALLAATAGLWIGAHWLVGAASRLAGAAGVSPLVIGLTVVAFGTSAPEIAVSTVAALEGNGDIAVGNVVGSNVFNLGVILGCVAILAPFRVTETMVRRDAVAMAGATAVAMAILANMVLTRVEGVVLLALLASYFGALGLAVRRSNGDAVEDVPTDANANGGRRSNRGVELLRLFGGLALVAGSGRVLVESATTIALSVGVSTWLVGVTIVAAGTSVPELVTSIVATRRDEVAIAAGNVIGSNVFNLLGVLGLAAVVRPITVDPAVPGSLVWLGVLTAIAAIVLATGRRLTRPEGVVLLAIAAGYWATSVLG
jgi:cation:H+ antiporter